MPELASLKTQDFELTIWAKDVRKDQIRLQKTLSSREKRSPISKILISPPVLIYDGCEPSSELCLHEAVFFENRQYEIEFTFNDLFLSKFKSEQPYVEHRLKNVEESFRYKEKTNSLIATINSGNDIGWFKFSLRYPKEGRIQKYAFSFEVFPTKMDMAQDLELINRAIDEEFPLWRYSLSEKTQHHMKAVKKPHPDFILLWLAQFSNLFHDFVLGLKHIVNAPHSRLVASDRVVRIDRLKGKMTSKLEERVALAIANKNLNKRFLLEKKVLSVDTPENRFIKATITSSVKKLTRILDVLTAQQLNPDKQRISNSFIDEVKHWRASTQRFQNNPLFKEVGAFSGLSRESLVLQQKPGYAKVHKVWQQLKWHLAALEGSSNLSLRNVAELYEVWCFLEVRRILLGDLGFEETRSQKVPMKMLELDVSFEGGLAGAFQLKRDDGIEIRLAHEPEVRKSGMPLRSLTVKQKPDIFLEVTFPDGEILVWLFDAKYRIEEGSEERDLVPYDAINQMHGYRDALIHVSKNGDDTFQSKSRPVVGGYALYPGFFDQNKDENPYDKEIEDMGIGAFSLLPSTDGSGSIWLRNFLKRKFRRAEDSYPQGFVERHYVEEAPRIPYNGTEVSHYKDLAIVANQLGPRRESSYIDSFRSGNATYYHTKSLAFKPQSIENHIIKEARYVAVALEAGFDRQIEYLYPVLGSRKVRRASISPEQSGTSVVDDPEEMYWLFELGNALKLKEVRTIAADQSFEIKLVSREDLVSADDWSAIPERYVFS
ncbi:DUF2357 domain-containing protein [Pseudomonadales bacterium]|nr:DUF2357 domain-containing protein [Pseudomonadales bacterium]